MCRTEWSAEKKKRTFVPNRDSLKVLPPIRTGFSDIAFLSSSTSSPAVSSMELRRLAALVSASAALIHLGVVLQPPLIIRANHTVYK